MKIVKFLWKKWMVVARPIGNFQSQLIISLFYLIILFAVAQIFRFFLNPFSLREKNSSFSKWDYPEQNLESAKKPF